MLDTAALWDQAVEHFAAATSAGGDDRRLRFAVERAAQVRGRAAVADR